MCHLQKAEETPVETRATEGEVARRDVTVSLLAGNVYGTLMGLVPALLLFGIFILFWEGRPLAPPPEGFGVLYTFIVLVAGIVVHELLHALGWMVFAGIPRSNIHIGVRWKLLTPFAHSDVRMSVRGYRWGTFLPGLVLGILPSLLAIVSGSLLLMGFGFFFTATAGGDFLILWLLRKVSGNAQVADHPSRVGAIVYF